MARSSVSTKTMLGPVEADGTAEPGAPDEPVRAAGVPVDEVHPARTPNTTSTAATTAADRAVLVSRTTAIMPGRT